MSRDVGARWAAEVDGYLQEVAFAGTTGVPGWTLVPYNEKTITLAKYMDEVNYETVNARTPYGAAVVKRRMKGVADGYVVMPLYQFRLLLMKGDWQ